MKSKLGVKHCISQELLSEKKLWPEKLLIPNQVLNKTSNTIEFQLHLYSSVGYWTFFQIYTVQDIMKQLSGNKYELTSSTALSSNSAIAASKDQQDKVQNSGLNTFFGGVNKLNMIYIE